MPPPPVWVPSQRRLIPSDTSDILVTNDKGDNEIFLGAMHRSPGICLMAEKNPGEQLRGRLMKGLSHHSLPQMGFLSFKLGRLDRTAHEEGEGRKEGKDGMGPFECNAV